MRLRSPIEGVRVLFLAAALAACGGDSVSPPSKVATTLVAVSGTGQTAAVASALPSPAVVQVNDQNGAPLSDVAVAWAVTVGGGSVSAASARTDANGRAQAIWTLGTTAGTHSITATVSGIPPAAFTATAAIAELVTVSLAPLGGSITTGDSVRVTGSSGDGFGNTVPTPMGTWSSSAPAVATVNGTGLIRGISPGTAQITVTLGTSASSVTVTVVPPPLTGLNLDIAGMYITQATQTLAGDVPLVAGRDGLLRVFARGTAANSAAPLVRVRIYQDGTLVDTHTIPSPGPATPTAVTEGALTASWNYRIPGAVIQPGMTVLADVDNGNVIPEDNEADNSYPLNGTPQVFDIRVVPALSARFVPVTQPDGSTGAVSEANKDSYTTLASALYPFSSIDADVRTPYSFNKILPSSYDTIWSRLLLEIETLRRAEGSMRYYYGVFDPAYASGGSGLGYIGNGSPFWRAAIGIDAASWRALTVAHEWGHNFGRQHVGCGSPSNPDPLYPHAGGVLGRDGWDARSNTLLPNASTFDIMSYCQPVWSSSYTYSAVLEFHTAAAGRTTAGSSPSLLIWGRTTPDGSIILEPAFQVDAPPSAPPAPGQFRLQATDATGTVLFQTSFDGQEVDHLGTRHFSFTVPMSELRGREPAALRVTNGSAQALQRSGPVVAAGRGSDDVRATRLSNGKVRLEWDAARSPMVLVRDPGTGEVLSFARGGSHTISATGAELDLNMSDGVTSRTRKVRIQQ